ncbi:hypothetical protein LTS10_009389 [Elasticomyces elasticus]|nr:hypothetical protein LTS10_009389 [Elasticomyces elasticus]
MSQPPTQVFSVFHAVTCNYPAKPSSGKLQDRGDRLTLLPVHDAQNRFRPEFLVTDPDVQMNTRVFPQTVAMLSYSNAEPLIPSQVDAIAEAVDADSEQVPDAERLAQDMADCIAYNGTTRLNLFTYTYTSLGNNEMEIRIWIHRKSALQPNGAEVKLHSDTTYDMSLHEFEDINTDREWYSNALNVLYRKSDRAWLHVEFQLQSQDDVQDNAIPPWKPRQGLGYNSAGTVDPSVTASVDDPLSCPICYQDFDGLNVLALRLECHDAHVVCTDCWSTWVAGKELDIVTCPHCRDRLTDEVKTTMKTGFRGNEYRRNDDGNDRYTDYETFIRANSDLDQRTHFDLSEDVTVNGSLFFKIWKHLIDGSLLEPETSTPFHLQPARYAEVQFISAIIEKESAEFENPGVTSGELYTTLMTRFRIALSMRLADSPVWATLIAVKQKQIQSVYGVAVDQYTRIGTTEFISKTLFRSLEFVRLRACHEAACIGWHYHGAKAYHAPVDKPNWWYV